MKQWVKQLSIGLMMWLLFTSSVHAEISPKEEAYLYNYHLILQTMKTQMEDVSDTGDTTLDFLYGMIPHHEAAVAMSRNIIKFSHNPQVKQIANQILKNQLAELEKMKTLLGKMKKNPDIELEKEEAYLKVYRDSVQQMIAKMERARATGNIEQDFLEEMIPHHEGAVEMAVTILQFTNSRELRQIARTILVSQKTQLIHMQRLLKTME